MVQRQLAGEQSDLVCDRSLVCACRCPRQPIGEIALQLNPSFEIQGEDFPGADGGKPEFILGVLQGLKGLWPKTIRVLQEPQPDVGVQEELQSRRTSHSFSSFAGEMMSPTISMESFIEPIQEARSTTAVGGMTSATGFPKRVTRMGVRVRRTVSSSARHLALNSEMETSFMRNPIVTMLYHGQNNSQFIARSKLQAEPLEMKCSAFLGELLLGH